MPIGWQDIHCFNSLAPGKFEWHFRHLIFQVISVIDGWGEFALRWMSLDLTDDKSTLVLVMALCHQATSHCLSQCWPRSPMPYGVTKPQWVKDIETCTKIIFTDNLQVYSLQKEMHFGIKVTEISFQLIISFGSGNGLVPNKWLAMITWASDGVDQHNYIATMEEDYFLLWI